MAHGTRLEFCIISSLFCFRFFFFFFCDAQPDKLVLNILNNEQHDLIKRCRYLKLNQKQLIKKLDFIYFETMTDIIENKLSDLNEKQLENTLLSAHGIESSIRNFLPGRESSFHHRFLITIFYRHPIEGRKEPFAFCGPAECCEGLSFTASSGCSALLILLVFSNFLFVNEL